MRLPAHYAIRFTGGYWGNRWIDFQPHDTPHWTLVTTFCLGCLIDKYRADDFMQTADLDPRYKLYKITLNAKKHE